MIRKLSAVLALCALATQAQMVSGLNMPGFHETLGLSREKAETFSVQYHRSSAPGNVLWPGEQASFEFQVVNTGDKELAVNGMVELIQYGTKGRPNDIWVPEVFKIADLGKQEVVLKIPANGFQNVTVSPKTPETKGAYALVLDLGPAGRRFVTSFVRTFQASSKPVQFPQLCLDNGEIELLTRLGAAPNRMGIGYKPTTDADFADWYKQTGDQLRAYKEAGLAITVEFGGGAFHHPNQPMGRPRPWLDDKGVMQDTKFDLAWLPGFDEDFKKFCKLFAIDYGWPKGPINGFKIWNEPWNGISISGWGADDLRYREIYIKMCEAVEEARKEADVQVLLGGCDSSSNTFDKLFGDGNTEFLNRLDFLSIHYQGMSPHSTVKMFVDRKHANGRVRIWDTESWVANTDDRVAAVVATNLSTGHDRAVGIYHGNIATEWHNQHARLRTAGGKPQDIRYYHTWPVAAAVGAVTHFIGERRFQELLFRPGLPWVMVFQGTAGTDGKVQTDDGTLVVIGDIGEAFGSTNVLFRNARGVKERAHEAELRKQLAAATAPDEKKKIQEAIDADEALSGATLTLTAQGKLFSLFDFYGNPVPSDNGRIAVPLDHRGFYLRADGTPGSFAKLVEAVRKARIDGIEPLAKVCQDMTAPISAKPDLRLQLTNVLNRPLQGKLLISLGALKLEPAEQTVSFQANETKEIIVKVNGTANPSNTYPLHLDFNAGADGRSVHDEEIHVNQVAHRTLAIDGKLDDWKDVLPQTVKIEGVQQATLTEKAWLPFMKYDESVKKGMATAYLAYDDKYFYFAAKIADATPDSGTLRFANRNEDVYFYPEVSYSKSAGRAAENFSIRWTGFVQARKNGKHTFISNSDDGIRVTVAGKKLVDNWTGHGATDDSGTVDLAAGKRFPITVEYFQGGGGCTLTLDWIEPGEERARVPAEVLFQREDGTDNGLTAAIHSGQNFDSLRQTRVDANIDYPTFVGDPGKAGFGKGEATLTEHRWPEGVRRYSYRKGPDLPAGNAPNIDNVQIAFNVLDPDKKWKYPVAPGTLPGYTDYVCTDYEYALNPVAQEFGGGTEIWRLQKPGHPHKHFYPHSPKFAGDGAVDGKLAIVRDEQTRYVECALPWSEIPDVKKRLEAGQTIKFSFRVNDNAGIGCLELSRNRSVAKRNGSFTVDWAEHWANELEFGWEK